MSGSVNVSGTVNATVLSTGDVAFKVYKVTATIPSTGTSMTITIPSTVTGIIGCLGGILNGTQLFPFAWTYDANWVIHPVINGGTSILVYLGSLTYIGGKTAVITIFYTG